MQSAARIILLTTIVVPILAVGFSLGTAGETEDWKRPANATAVALDETCHPMTDVEAGRAELALHVLETFTKFDDIYDGAMRVFGRSDKQSCVPEPMKQRIARATLRAGVWNWGLAGSTRLSLAHQFGPRDPTIVSDVARSAFSSEPIEELVSSDVRPEARSVLASFGRSAAPWRVEAMKLMNANDSLGTSAAQVAAASGDPGAVGAVAELLREELKSHKGKAIERDRGKRLVELAYALGAAREVARPWVGLLTQLLNHDVQSLAPPFGLIERPPNEVCRALRRIGGAKAENVLRSERCKQPWFVLPS